MRREKAASIARPVDTFQINPVPPFRLDLTAWALRRDPANRLDRWDGTTYRRALSWENIPFEMSVRQTGSTSHPSLEVIITSIRALPELRAVSAQALDRLLGIGIDLTDFYRFTLDKKELKTLVERFRGVKPPRFPGLFEALANGFIFQQISLPSGMALLNRLVETFGQAAPGTNGRAFPSPESIAGMPVEDLRLIGMSRQKGRYLTELASRITRGLKLEQIEALNDEEAVSFLYDLSGVGRWTAQYCLLRGLGRIHVFPGDDIGARNRIKKWLGLEEVPDYQRMQDISAGWYPYGGMVYFHLLLNHLAEKGYLI